MDSLILMPDFIKTSNAEEHTTREHASSSVLQLESSKPGKEDGENEIVEVENVERPVDLYKV